MDIKVNGLNALITKIGKMPQEINDDLKAAFNDWADRVSQDAKQTLSGSTSNTGNLANSIKPVYAKYNAKRWEVKVVATANYAAYVEFGTRKFAAQYIPSLPDEWQKMASQSKGGSGGDFGDLLLAIYQWAHERGIKNTYSVKTQKKKKRTKKQEAELLQLVWVIAFSILKNGIRPQPYLYPAVIKNNPILLQDIKDIFK